MYGQLLVLIENRIDGIVQRVVGDMQAKSEFRYYLKMSERAREERIGNVIRDMCERLGCWLNRESPRSSLSTHYSRLGAQRCREGLPLEEVILVILLIKRSIWDELKGTLVVDNSFTLNHLRELESKYHLFLDRMIVSVITGYQGELGRKLGDGGSGGAQAGKKAGCKQQDRVKPKAGQTAKEE